MFYLASQMFICDVVDGTLCSVPTIHIPVSAVCTVGHNENVDEGVQVKLLELVSVSPEPFDFTSSALASQKNHKSQDNWLLQIYYSEVY